MVFEALRGLIRPDPSRPAMVVDGVTETFRLYHSRPRGLKERLYRFRRASYTDFNALEDVTFTVEHGESVGIIGHNGSGKSTLLKVLARILPPDVGRIEINGRVASLLELGAGFHGDLSGRENIYLNGAILGLTRSEVEERFDDIVDFADVRAFLDTPVRNYSSGMYVRLGFAIAVHVDPDILLVDEVLSVGDAPFQEKSLQRMEAFQDRGKTVVLVSHDLGAIERLCDRVLVLEEGRIAFDGPVREGVRQYTQLTATSGGDRAAAGPASREDDSAVVVERASLLGPDGLAVGQVAPSTPLTLRVRIRAREDVSVCSVGTVLRTGDGRDVYETHTTWQGLGIGPLRADQTAVVDIGFVAHLLAGHYTVDAVATDPTGRRIHHRLVGAERLDVRPAPGGIGLVDLEATTSVYDGPALRLDLGHEAGSDPDVASTGTGG